MKYIRKEKLQYLYPTDPFLDEPTHKAEQNEGSSPF